MIFNTHSHINDKLDNLDELVDECLEKGVNKIAVVGYDFNSSVRAIQAAKKRKEVYAICGLQPTSFDGFDGDFDFLGR
jgi:TatD DNase family protein